jgi:hypothetical protein
MTDEVALPPIGGTHGRISRRLGDRGVLLALTGMTLAALLLALWTTRTINPLRGDSAEYLYFDPSRTVGYPAFLWLVRLITGHVAAAVPAQIILVGGSLLCLGWSVHKSAGRPAFSLAFQAILLCQVAMWKASAFLMTEALATAAVAIWCAQLLRMIRAPSFREAVLLVAISGVAATVRPSLVALFFGTAVMILAILPARERGRALSLVGIGLVMAWAATPIALLLVHGSTKSTSPFARGVLQHTLYCDPHGVPKAEDSAFVEQSAAPVRRYIESAPPDVREQLRRAYSSPLRFGLIIPVLGRRHHLDARSQVDPYLSRVANERLEANPLCYAKSVAGAYYRMATFGTNRTTEDEHRIRSFMAVHPPVELPQYPVLPREAQLDLQAAEEVHNDVTAMNRERQQLDFSGKISALLVLPVRLLYAAAALIGILSLAALVAGRREVERQKLLAGPAAMGIAFHCTLAITALVELGLSRYVVPLWPLVCSLVAASALNFLDRRRAAGNLRIEPAQDGLEPVFA